MEFYVTEKGVLGIRGLNSFVLDLMRQIPLWTRWDSQRAEARLFSNPSAEDSEEGESLREDWKIHVHPSLHELFLSCRETVEADLRRVEKVKEDSFLLEIPAKHTAAWLNALGQARLAIVAEREFTEKELEVNEPVVIEDERSLALFQVGFYAMMQHWIIEGIDPEA